jgi:hypothetical protein
MLTHRTVHIMKNIKEKVEGERALVLPSAASVHCGDYRDGFQLLDMNRAC